ncbi:hypothetical protein SNEBB_006316 [Seison nebaliae]|nr:hypothetical protein SNEBB_006316 [Seison nebaliae]
MSNLIKDVRRQMNNLMTGIQDSMTANTNNNSGNADDDVPYRSFQNTGDNDNDPVPAPDVRRRINRVGSDPPPDSTDNTSARAEPARYTVDQAVDHIGFGMFQVKLSLLTGLAWMADAMEMMILSILGPALSCEWMTGDWQKAAITTCVFCGMMISSSFWGKICDKYGRRTELVLFTLFTFYYGLLSAFAPTLIWVLILRGLVGVGIGGCPQSVTLYAEFLPARHRARCVILVEVFWAIGACFEVLLALAVMPTLGWRWLLGLSALPELLFALFCVWLPESPRFLLAIGAQDKAQATLQRAANENKATLPVGQLIAPRHNQQRGQISDLLQPENRRTTLLLWFLWFANAFAYYGIILMTTELFEMRSTCEAKISEKSEQCYLKCLTKQDYIDVLWTTLAEFPGLFITVFIVEYIGRKKTMALELLLFSIFTFLVNICTSRQLMTFFIFVARAFVSGAFQVAYVYTPEVYPTTTRAVGLGVCSGMARVGAILTPFVAQVLLRTSVNFAISLYGCVGLLAAVASFLLPIETTNRSMT